MGTKRAHDDFDSEGAQTHDQRSNSPGSEDGQHDNKRFKATKRKHRAKEGTTNWNKTRARAIRRLLQSGKELPATKRNELEQELQALQERVEEHDFRKRRSNMIQKYHMVRFFERKKAERLLKQLRKKLQQTEDAEEKKRLEAEAHVAEVDVAYARFFPLMERYESLYADKNKDAGDGEQKQEEGAADKPDEADADKPFKQPKALQALHAERPKMWATVEKVLPEGEAALYRLRDRKSPADAAPHQRQPLPQRKQRPARAKEEDPWLARSKKSWDDVKKTRDPKQPMNRRERRALERKAPKKVEEEDDGTGFFE
ncbi:Putative rRNA-processing protein Efg1 [Colletotrichum destructivum]|uniref:rRNA-processing protein EFG1 n=1 Tax=Colletotrichum destructivum TaxID=34406 RepID=A0AAX4HZ90_9PEZI|nr:Putative rRNA-processing protein Efg1 [Colletotrichum destructivum]